MKLQYFLILIASVVFLFGDNFANGIHDAFSFLFWANIFFLLPIVFLWIIIQFAAIASLSFSFIGVVLAPIISAFGWWILLVFGVNTWLCWYIKDNLGSAENIFAIPVATQIAIVVYFGLVFLLPKLKKQQTTGFKYESYTNTQKPDQASNDVIIDAEIIEKQELVEHKK